jgi:hypothetical protein
MYPLDVQASTREAERVRAHGALSCFSYPQTSYGMAWAWVGVVTYFFNQLLVLHGSLILFLCRCYCSLSTGYRRPLALEY